MTLISSPVFVCFVVALALLLGFLLGGRWQRRAYDAVWRDGAACALFKIRSSYSHLPRKLRLVLEATEFRMRVGWPEPLQLTQKEIVSDDISRADRAEADTPTDS